MSAENEHVNQCRQQHSACRREELHTRGAKSVSLNEIGEGRMFLLSKEPIKRSSMVLSRAHTSAKARQSTYIKLNHLRNNKLMKWRNQIKQQNSVYCLNFLITTEALIADVNKNVK